MKAIGAPRDAAYENSHVNANQICLSRINSLAFVSGCCAGHILDFALIIHGELIGQWPPLWLVYRVISGYNGGQVAAGSW